MRPLPLPPLPTPPPPTRAPRASLLRACLPPLVWGNLAVLPLVAALGAGLLGVAGCEPRGDADVVTPPPPPPSPQARYERFMADLRRRIASNPGNTNTYTGSGATYQGDYQIVSDRLIPPASPDGVYRAEGVIRVQSSFMIYDTGAGDEQEEPEAKSNPQTDMLSEEDRKLLDSIPGMDAVPAAGRQKLDSAVHTRESEELIEYSLVDVDGAWRLKNGIDARTFRFLSESFRLALESQ